MCGQAAWAAASLSNKFLGKETDIGAHVESEIVFLILNLAGDLNQTVLRIYLDFAVGPSKMERAGGANRELATRKIDEYVVVAENAGRQVDFDAHAGGELSTPRLRASAESLLA